MTSVRIFRTPPRVLAALAALTLPFGEAMQAAGAQTPALERRRVVTARFPGGYLHVEVRADGRVIIGALSARQIDGVSGAFVAPAVAIWAERASVLLADSVTAPTDVPIMVSEDGAASLLLAREQPDPRVVRIEVRRARDDFRVVFRATASDSALVALVDGARAAAAEAEPMAERTRLAAALRAAAARDSLRMAGVRLRLPDRIFVAALVGGVAGVVSRKVGGQTVGCQAIDFPPGCTPVSFTVGFGVGSVLGASVGASAVGPRRCRVPARFARALIGAGIGALPGAAFGSSNHKLALVLMTVGEAAGATIAVARCR